ncbi:MAG: aminoacyl-histidine dipeptidase [Candidatus Krumholzibacteria bacterium]|nr:aminoacyl-histidine dipeptidase [Candidatus Krumholzibacteria bacterium]
MTITDYEPKSLWTHFDEIRKIPRCSGNEEQARQYVLGFAKSRDLEADHDSTGNVVVRVPATPGHENAPVVAIQGHLDMVCEKNADVQHDFAKDPIQLLIDGEWLKAKGTTLGSDNGVGVAAALAVADDGSVVHGPLELLFTVDEEVGLTGAGKLEPGFLKAKILLNLDSEELGSVFIGCAGGGDSTIKLPLKRTQTPKDVKTVSIRVAGLRGGHSGLDIVEQRGNAIKILARVLWETNRSLPLALSAINGGNKRNAIPRECAATTVVEAGKIDALGQRVARLEKTIAAELGGREKGLRIVVEPVDETPSKVVDEPSQRRLVNLLLTIPHGVDAMNYDIPDLVETSNNLASVSTSESQVTVGTSSRSSINSALQSLRDRIRGASELAGASVEENEPYPGWKPNLESKLLTVIKQVHKELFGEEPEARAIHAGLECGIIGEKYPGMDMISFGPHIEHPHSPDERIHIASVEKFWKLLAGTLQALA